MDGEKEAIVAEIIQSNGEHKIHISHYLNESFSVLVVVVEHIYNNLSNKSAIYYTTITFKYTQIENTVLYVIVSCICLWRMLISIQKIG